MYTKKYEFSFSDNNFPEKFDIVKKRSFKIYCNENND